MLTPIDVSESFNGMPEFTGRRVKVRLIEADKLGTYGFYPADVIKRDGPKVFTKGTPMFLDHQTPEQRDLLPFGSVDTYAAELAEDAYFENDGLYADVEVFEHQAAKIKSLANRIGVSIRAKAVMEPGMIGGKKVNVIQQITEARSVDFVMRAGAGGKIVSILESAVEESSDSSINQDGENMELKDIVEGVTVALDAKFGARLTALEEAASKLAPVEESGKDEVDPTAKALEIAEAFVDSTLDAEGRKRVLAIHKASGDDIAKLIEAEEAYVKSHAAKADDAEGVEESADKATDVEESANKITVPIVGAWKKD